MNWIAVLPLRGGSKSIPKKNMRLIAGRPLYAWSLQSALQSEVFSKVIVSSDSSEILDDVQTRFPDVECLKRPSELATDEASSESVLVHAVQNQKYDVVSLIQATSPMTEAKDFICARDKFVKESADSLVTVVRNKRFFWNPDGTPINYDFTKRPRRQDFQGSLMETGSFYFSKRQVIEKSACRLGGNVSVYEMNDENAVEIDEPMDWIWVERMLHKKKWHPQLNKIKALVCDVDGTLTDGGMYYSPDGEMAKKFHTADWHGLQKLSKEKGIKPIIMTREDSRAVHARVKKVGITDYYFGVEDKLTLLKTVSERLKIPLHQFAFIGDDDGDKASLENVGFSACPSDAQESIRSSVQYICQKEGGKGAVREICDLLLGS